MNEREYSYGIYYFIDIQKDEIAYIGLDSHIDRRQRIKDHYQACKYGEQSFNRVLQNNPERFIPHVYCECDTWEEMVELEFNLIKQYEPRFNYLIGKHGGKQHSKFEYSVAKSGFNKTEKQTYVIYSMTHKQLISSVDYEFLSELCSKLNSGELTPDEVKNIKRKIIRPHEDRIKRSKLRNKSGFFRVSKIPIKTYKQGFAWSYQYYLENGKQKLIRRANLFDLEKVVKSRGLPWQVVDLDKAINTIKCSIGF